MWKYIFVLIEHHTPPPALSAKVFSRDWKFPLRLRCPLLGEANVILTACNPKTYSWIYITTGVIENIQRGILLQEFSITFKFLRFVYKY
jgi:hypothetical protein